jgi:hypothetical protein
MSKVVAAQMRLLRKKLADHGCEGLIDTSTASATDSMLPLNPYPTLASFGSPAGGSRPFTPAPWG